MKANITEVGKIIDEMTTDFRTKPNYNQAAADIVKAGVKDKLDARNGYTSVLTSPRSISSKITL